MATFDYKSQSKRALDLGDKYYDLANSYLDNFVDKLISASIFSLGFIGLLIQKVDIRNYPFSEYIFILGTLAFILVILLGIFFKYTINKFLSDVGDSYNDRHRKIEHFIYENNSSEGKVEIDKVLNLSKILDEHEPWWYKFQISLFLIGVICFGFLLFSILTFDTFKNECIQII
ncbi:MAG: hypothetical protein WA082_04110 [Candidatus Moraniibacteriota bacterium]